METEALYIAFKTIANISSIIVVPIMTSIIGRRLWNEYKNFKKINVIRLLTFCIFLSFSWTNLWEFLYETSPLAPLLPSYVNSPNAVQDITLYSIGIGFMVTFALTLTIYANKLEAFYLAPLSFYLGILIYYIATGNVNFHAYYVYGCAIVGLIFFYVTGFRLKDDGPLGLGILFTITYISLIFSDTLIGEIFFLASLIFGAFFSLGYFNVFKSVEEN
ncbi:MAG: hypothetical protein ACTSU4_01120 [Promethearchaeota archaeon]